MIRRYTYDLLGPSFYLFADAQGVATEAFTPKLVIFDAGPAWRPFRRFPHFEFRAGAEGVIDLRLREPSVTWYGSARVVY